MNEDATLVYPTSDYQAPPLQKSMISVSFDGQHHVYSTPYWCDVWMAESTCQPGDLIKAYDQHGILCGLAVIQEKGGFVLHIYGDDPITPIDEGAIEGELVELRLNNTILDLDPEVIYREKNSVTLQTLTKSQTLNLHTYELFQNHPNPFNTSTTISYYISHESRVSLTIYNLTGQLVKTLGDQKMSPGNYTIVWDGHDDKDQKSSSGVYVCKMMVEGLPTLYKKMILLQ